MMYICKIRSAPPSSPPSPPSAPVATPARACPSGSAPPAIVMNYHDENNKGKDNHKGNRNHKADEQIGGADAQVNDEN